MRLVDKVVAVPVTVSSVERPGAAHIPPGSGSKRDSIRSCPVRYILDEEVAGHCLELVLDGKSLCSFDARLFQLPASHFWLEWMTNPPYSEEPNLRTGLLVEADESGRRGMIAAYAEDARGEPRRLGADLEFDLDEELAGLGDGNGCHRLRHSLQQGLDPLFRHVLLRTNPAWLVGHGGQCPVQVGRAVRDLAETLWFALPFVLAFSALLNTRGALAQRPSELARLNRARRRRGRAELLDHLEISMRLGAGTSPVGGYAAPSYRRAARLHHVRGHLVHRSGKIFWRAPHLRGDSSRMIARKTVTVRA